MTQLEVQPPAPSDKGLTEFDKSIKFLSDLPTERAMKDVSKMRASEAMRKVIETMALSKMDLIKSLRLMQIQINTLNKAVENYSEKLEAFKDLEAFLKEYPDYDINITKK